LTELSAAIEPLLRVREGMRTERKAFDRTLASAARRSDVGRRLMTIPGVGPVTTLAYIATVDATPAASAPRKRSAHISA
jgi:transposase